MLVTWISQFRWAAVTLGAVQSYTTAIVGIMLVPSMQLLVTPVQIALNSRGVNFPGSIIVMALCTITMLGIEYLHQGIGSVYDSYLKGPVSRSHGLFKLISHNSCNSMAGRFFGPSYVPRLRYTTRYAQQGPHHDNQGRSMHH